MAEEAKETEPAVDSQLMTTYLHTYPGDKEFEELPNSPMAAIENAVPKEDALFDMNISDCDLYYSFLADVVKQHPMDLEKEEEVFSRQRDVAKAMWKADMDYFRIIRCLTYMPLNIGTSDRYTHAVIAVASTINPVLTLPEIQQAKPINQLTYNSSNHDIYHSYLKAVLQRNPSQKLRDADKEVVKLLHRAKLPADTIKNCLKDNSLEFMTPVSTGDAVTDYQKTLAVYNRLRALLKEAYQEIEPKRPMSMLDINPLDEDNVVYQKMQTAIRQMKDQHEQGDSFQYWEKSIRIMQETLNRFNAFQNLSKTVTILTVGVARAAKECEVKIPPELEQIQKQLQALNQQTDRRKQDWMTLRETADRVVKISTQLVGELREKRAKNPLLQLVEVQHAKPLAQVLQEPKPVPKELYFASLRQIARGNPGILPDQADLLVAKQLRAAKLSDDVCLMALRASPCFRQLDSSQKMAAARSVLDTVDAPPEHRREEGNHR